MAGTISTTQEAEAANKALEEEQEAKKKLPPCSMPNEKKII